MRKTYSKDELQQMGAEIAAANNVDKLFSTNDGQFFLPKKKGAAELHKKSEGLELYELEYKAEVKPEATAKPKAKTPDEKIAEIGTLETIAAVENYIAGEKNAKVLEAAKAKQEALKQAEVKADEANGK